MITTPIELPRGPVMVDVAGHRLTDHERARLRHPLVGGVILFARNFSDRAHLEALCDEIHALRSAPLLIAVDHEGGRVQRFRSDGLPNSPPCDAWARPGTPTHSAHCRRPLRWATCWRPSCVPAGST